MNQRVGFIGLGDIGKPMALSIARNGFPMVVYDIRPEQLVDLTAVGAKVARSPREVADNCDVMVIMVLNHLQVEQVLVGESGALPALNSEKTVIVMCTIAPSHTKRFGEMVNATGARYLDAAVSGGVWRAVKGELTIMVGGPAEILESCRPVLQAMGSLVRHVGPRIGDGQVVKMCNNMLVGIHYIAAAEAMALGVKAGVDPQAIDDVVTQSTGNSVSFETRVETLMARDFSRWKGALRTLHKDMGIVLTEAAELHVPMFLAPVVYQFFQKAMISGWEGQDDTAVFKVIEEITGVEIRRKEVKTDGVHARSTPS
jgi:3-hydroxyisobutyrate dehydrogenase